MGPQKRLFAMFEPGKLAELAEFSSLMLETGVFEGGYAVVLKLTFSCPASLKADLDRYAALHAQAYGEAVDAMTLIPHMLEAFMAGDRGFRKGTTPRSAPSKPT